MNVHEPICAVLEKDEEDDEEDFNEENFPLSTAQVTCQIKAAEWDEEG